MSVRIHGRHVLDAEGRVTTLRGVNVSSNSKVSVPRFPPHSSDAAEPPQSFLRSRRRHSLPRKDIVHRPPVPIG